MKLLGCIALASAALLGPRAVAQGPHVIPEAEAAASAWLKLVDAGDYPASWSRASSLFKAAVAESSWEAALKRSRGPLGSLESREVQSATFTHALPGAPDGEYVVITYASRFEHKASAIETVTPMREKDGSWRVSGYYVK